MGYGSSGGTGPYNPPDSDLTFLDPALLANLGGSAQLQNPLASMPPPANGGRYGSPDEDWWRKIARMYMEEQGQQQGQQQQAPLDAFAARRQAAQEGRVQLAPREGLISPELAELIGIGTKIAAAS
tara:strand:+ start:1209 stop:1586 length:378 start_codon:yes stop_codon:yes gene_type:complete